jgi:hypothetical protein
LENQKTYQYTFAFDDKNDSFNKEKGININQLSRLLDIMSKIAGASGMTIGQLTLSNVFHKCQAYSLTSTSKSQINELTIASKNIALSDPKDLTRIEREFAKNVNLAMPEGGVFKVIDIEGNTVVQTGRINLRNSISSYFITEDITGIFTRMGSHSLSNSYIEIPPFKSKIKVSQEQDLELRPFYREIPIRATVRMKVSVKTGHISSAELIDFTPLNSSSFYESIKDYLSKGLGNDFTSNDQIIDLLNG